MFSIEYELKRKILVTIGNVDANHKIIMYIM